MSADPVSSTQNLRKPKAARFLSESEQTFTLLVGSVKDYAIFMLDPSGRIMTWNAGAELIKGYRASEIVGRHFSVFYPQEEIDAKKPEWELEFATRTGRYEEEGWRVRKDGTRFWANVVITAIFNSENRLIGFGKVTRDLTDRKLVEQALRESEEKFRMLAEGVRDYAIFMLDPDGRVASWNLGAKRMKGYEASEIIGQSFTKFYEREDVEAGKCEFGLREAIRTGSFEDEGWRVRKNGTRFWANVVITALFDSNGTLRGFSKVTRDITERKRAEDRLRAAYSDLEKRVETRTQELSEAVKVRDEFLSIASHELKTPITSLKLQMQMLLKRIQNYGRSAPDLDKIRYSAEISVRQISRLNALVDDLLDVSRVRAGRLTLHFEQVDLVALAQEVVHRMTEQLQSAGCSVELVAPAVLSAWADPQRLDQVLTNFLSNAAKYAPRRPVVVRVSDLGGKARVAVQDSGPGIPLEEQERIFDRFERAASSDISGMGLGLYISRSIVLAHQGEIRVESEPGKGASFIFEIPTEPRLDQ